MTRRLDKRAEAHEPCKWTISRIFDSIRAGGERSTHTKEHCTSDDELIGEHLELERSTNSRSVDSNVVVYLNKNGQTFRIVALKTVRM